MLPDGFIYVPEFLTVEEEGELIETIRHLDFREFQMYGVMAKRRVVHFGWDYSFDSRQVTPTTAIPAEFTLIRNRAAILAGIESAEFAEALVTEYQPGAGIGWHRDAPPFGIIAGISLAGGCRMRFQRGKGKDRETAAVELEPRSIYLLRGSARKEWQHTIPATKELRYSITFRTLKQSRGRVT